MTDATFELVARVELPTRDLDVWKLLIEAAGRVGLAIERLAITDVSSQPSPRGFDARDLLRAIADPRTRRIEIGANSPAWQLAIPLSSGALTGTFAWSAFRTPGPLEMPALRWFAHVFDMNLVEWGLVGPGAGAMLPSDVPTDFEGPAALPGLSWITYVSPDLAYPPDLAECLQVESIRRIRTHIGGAVMALRTTSDTAALARLRAVCPGLFAVWDRPAIDAYPVEGGDLLLARDVSAGLANCQRDAANIALAEAQRCGVERAGLTSRTLDAVERAFASSANALPAWLVESWSALAGELAVQHGDGEWRRELDPRLPFPDNLLVMLPGNIAFAPHRELRKALAGSGPLLGQVLRERLVLSKSRAGLS